MTTQSSRRNRTEQELEARLRQQAVVADLSLRALGGVSLPTLMHEAVTAIADTLGVEYCRVSELLPDGKELLVRCGVGWKEGYVGRTTVGAGTESQAGYALLRGEPVIVKDLRAERRFNCPPSLRDHGVVSGVSVIIRGATQDRPFGELGAHTTRLREFTVHDVNFLRAVANLLAASIERKRTEDALREGEERFRLLADHAQDMVFRYRRAEPHGFEYVSPAVTAIAGYRPEDYYADPSFASKVIHPHDEEKLRQMVRERTTEPVELRWIRKDGTTIWTEQRNVPIYDESGTVIAMEGIVRDITKRKLAEEELQKARDELESRVEQRLAGGSRYGLTFRELTVLHLVADGLADKEIAAHLGISPLTVQKHISNILNKMNAASRTEAGVRAVRERLL